MKFKAFQMIGLALTACLLCGCASYQAGSPGPKANQAVYIKPIVNRSYAPQIRVPLAEELIQAFLRDGNYTISPNSTSADLILEVIVDNYSREGVASRQDDTGRSLSFDLALIASITLLDGDGTMLIENRLVDADATVYTTDGLPSAEYDSMPLLAKELARRIRDTVDGSW